MPAKATAAASREAGLGLYGIGPPTDPLAASRDQLAAFAIARVRRSILSGQRSTPDYSPFTAADRERFPFTFNGPIDPEVMRDLMIAVTAGGGVTSVAKTMLIQRGETRREQLRQDGMTARAKLGQADADGGNDEQPE
jgi:hypothetical protein